MNADTKYFEDLSVGDTFRSPGRTVTEADVVSFAGLSGDFNELHTNEVVAQEIYGSRIAHGMLIMAMQSGLGQRALGIRVATRALLGISDWRFLEPVRLGDTVSVEIEIAEMRPASDGRRGIVHWRRQVVNQHGTVVQTGTTVTMVALRGS